MVNFKKIFAVIVLLTLLLTIINGALPQFQLAIFGDIVIAKGTARVIMGLALLLSIIFQVKYKGKTNLLLIWWIFVVYLAIDAFRFSLLHISMSDVLMGYNFYYAVLVLIPLCFFLEKSISENIVKRIIIFLLVPLSILGISQFIQKGPILPLYSPDQSFKVMSYDIGNESIRAFSLFDSGLSFGHFLCLSMAIVVSSIILSRKKIGLNTLFLGFISAATYMTVTRNIYIEFVLVFLSVILISILKNKSMKFVRLIPLLYLALGYFINSLAPKIATYFSNSTIVDVRTLLIRQNIWENVQNVWFSDLGTFLFGAGLNQYGGTGYHITIDNTFFAVAIHIGLIGLVIWGFFMWNIWEYCLKRIQQSSSQLDIAFVSFMSTFLVTGIFNITFMIYIVVFILMVITKDSAVPMNSSDIIKKSKKSKYNISRKIYTKRKVG